MRPRWTVNADIYVELPDTLGIALPWGERFVADPVLAAMAETLDGRLDADELVARFPSLFPPLAYHRLEEGLAEGLLRDADRDDPQAGETIAFLDMLGVSGTEVRAAKAGCAVCVIACDGMPCEALRARLAGDGLTLVERPEDASLVVVALRDYLQPEFVALAEACRLGGRRFLAVRLRGTAIWLGPLIAPGAATCAHVLQRALARNREIASYVDDRATVAAPPPLTDEGAAAFGYEWLALEILRVAIGGDSALSGTLLEYDVIGGRLLRHPVPDASRCEDCGHVRAPDGPPLLGSRAKTAILSPQASLRALRSCVSPLTGGIRASHAQPPTASEPLHHHRAIISFPMVRDDIAVLAENARGRCGGAGTTAEAAEILALGEAVERASGVWRPGEDRDAIVARRRDLGDDAIDIADCLLFSARQIAARDAWNPRQTAPRELVPRPLDDGERIGWQRVWPLGGGAPRLLPSLYCHYGHPDAAKRFCLTDSNGCAAGESLESATLSALLELIERDSVALWWYNRIALPRLDLDGFDLPYLTALRRRYAEEDRDLVVLDLTSDLGIPVFAASSARIGAPSEDIMLGFGAGLDGEQAMARALRELSQFHPIVARRRADGRTIYETASDDTARWLATARRADHPYLGSAGSAVRRAAEIASLTSCDIRDEIDLCVAAIRRAGSETYLLDQSRTDLGAPACRVIAPGLRHFWRRLGPGRLYRAPVELGWLERCREEDELNPVAIFF